MAFNDQTLQDLKALKEKAEASNLFTLGVLMGAIQELLEEKISLEHRLQHLLESDYIRSFDEYDPKSHTYKRDIKEADKLKTEVHCNRSPVLYIKRDPHLEKQLLGHVQSYIYTPGKKEPYTDGRGVVMGFTTITPPVLTIQLEEEK